MAVAADAVGLLGQVLTRAGLDLGFYLATKHWCVHYMHAELSLPPRVIAEGMDWTLAGEAAGHARPPDGALDEIDKALRANVTEPRAVDSATTGTHGGPQSAS